MLRVLRLYFTVAREHAPHTTSVLKSCDFPAGAAGVRSACYVAIFKPELRGCAPRTTFVLKSYLKVAIFQPELREHAPHTTSVLKSCDFPAGAAGARSAYYVCT